MARATRHPSRRQVLRSAGALSMMTPFLLGSAARTLAAAAPSADPTTIPLPARPSGTVASRVAVIGAGLAGLAAAWELAQAGHEVMVLEARQRPGGRVRTQRDAFAGDLYTEAGAVAFSGAYTAANRYIDALALERAPYALPSRPAVYHLRGRRFVQEADREIDWPYELTDAERRLRPGGMLSEYLINAMPMDIDRPHEWQQTGLGKLDEISLAQWLRGRGASDEGVQLFAPTQYFSEQPDRTSALSVALVDIGLFFRGDAMFVLAGGNDRLPRAMADRLGDKLQYGVEVTALSTDDDEVTIHGRRNAEAFTATADFAVVTVPAPVLRGIRIEPALRRSQREAIDKLPYRDNIRAQIQVREAFWLDEGVSGAAVTDLFIGRIDRQPYFEAEPKGRAVLEAFIEGDAALRLRDRPESEILAYALAQLEQIHPRVRDYAEGGIVKSWSDDPFSRGGYSWPGPGDVTRYLGALQQAHGRIHFAGEHTSILRATMEGALRSGVRAAREVDGVVAAARDRRG